MLRRKTQLVPISVIKTIGANAMFAPGDKVLVAFSGGPDSTALVHILRLKSERCGISLHLAYLNHRLRGGESDAEQGFVERTAKQLSLPIEMRALSEDESRQLLAGSVEAQARAVRLEFLRDAAEAVGAQKIATGHTFDDHVETLLMRLFTGTGPEGFAGIQAISGMFVRPLIETPKDDLLKFLSDNSIEYFQDSTNLSCDYLRNRVRRDLVPRIVETFGPHALLKLASFSRVITFESEIVADVAAAAYLEARCELDGRLALSVDALKSARPAIRNRVLKLALSEMDFPDQSIYSRHIASIAALAASANPHARTRLPGGVNVARCGDVIVFGAPDASNDAYLYFRSELTVPGRAVIPSAHLVVSARIVDGLAHTMPAGQGEALLDAGVCLVCGDKLIVRSLGPRDSFTPLGMSQCVQIPDFLKKQKVKRQERQNYPLITRQDGKVLWVLGQRIDDDARVTESTTSGLLLTLSLSQDP
ncbi:MAG: tRNA lysidine(34) synthetase TilS [Candidatus Coatesbacteria bacterium]|nr:tRNA lysidine(34) synthetase TilS [Candidatus Coatesbacteria bacterium]